MGKVNFNIPTCVFVSKTWQHLQDEFYGGFSGIEYRATILGDTTKIEAEIDGYKTGKYSAEIIVEQHIINVNNDRREEYGIKLTKK